MGSPSLQKKKKEKVFLGPPPPIPRPCAPPPPPHLGDHPRRPPPPPPVSQTRNQVCAKCGRSYFLHSSEAGEVWETCPSDWLSIGLPVDYQPREEGVGSAPSNPLPPPPPFPPVHGLGPAFRPALPWAHVLGCGSGWRLHPSPPPPPPRTRAAWRACQRYVTALFAARSATLFSKGGGGVMPMGAASNAKRRGYRCVPRHPRGLP